MSGSPGKRFDLFVTVDWSAASRPKLGRDSIWIARRDADGETVENVPTRRAAERRLAEFAGQAIASRRSMLVGLDFSFGFPAGFARAIGGSSWADVWRELAARISDGDDNANNRFEVAGSLNQRVSAGRGPFWGCPPRAASASLGPRRVDADFAGMDQFRLCERRARGAQSSFKLAGAGAVGSQALLGIAAIERFRARFRFAADVAVWPLETGFRRPEAMIALAEIYPSLFAVPRDAGEVKDSAQVRAAARHFERAEREGLLDELFQRPRGLSAGDSERILREEGWILGVW